MNINIKDKLKDLRHKKGITQESLANHLGITPQSVGKWDKLWSTKSSPETMIFISGEIFRLYVNSESGVCQGL